LKRVNEDDPKKNSRANVSVSSGSLITIQPDAVEETASLCDAIPPQLLQSTTKLCEIDIPVASDKAANNLWNQVGKTKPSVVRSSNIVQEFERSFILKNEVHKLVPVSPAFDLNTKSSQSRIYPLELTCMLSE
jgi:hypothetical protein